jgi:hypothetical protein
MNALKTLGDYQRQFVKMIGVFIQYAYQQGFELTFTPENLPHMPNSLHFCGLAKDFNLFKNGAFLETVEAYTPLGEFWEQLGGTWGGRFRDENGNSKPDADHFSLPYGGVK